MQFSDLIDTKKQGKALSEAQIHFWIEGYVKGWIPDYQVSALCMAIYFQGMNKQEIAWLCEAMLYSGEVMDLTEIAGKKADKHSTGGVGDKTSLALAPMVAACGGKIAKMSGRGLGHTGGTLDKAEAISGFQVSLEKERFIQQVNAIGLALIGQSKHLVPADQLLYALRDVSGTVDSLPLIATSIMSKKLAAGADTILLDVKYGSGAFMHTPKQAKELAMVMIELGKHFGKDTRAMITDMNQPLGNAIGNALEVKEAIATLQGHGPKDFVELCLCAGSIMLVQSELAKDRTQARAMLQDSITSGKALAKLKALCEWQGGEVEQIVDPTLLPQAERVIPIYAKQEGYVSTLHALRLGHLAMRLGAGRNTKEDRIDPAVGIVLHKKAGSQVHIGEPLAYVHTNRPLEDAWLHDFYDAYEFSKEKPTISPLIYEIIE